MTLIRCILSLHLRASFYSPCHVISKLLIFFYSVVSYEKKVWHLLLSRHFLTNYFSFLGFSFVVSRGGNSRASSYNPSHVMFKLFVFFYHIVSYEKRMRFGARLLSC